MTTVREQVAVRCPRCAVTIEEVTAETMVYCIACRKWCREMEPPQHATSNTAPPLPRPRRRVRCH